MQKSITITLNNVPAEMYDVVYKQMAKSCLKDFGHLVEIKENFVFDFTALDGRAKEEFLVNAIASQCWLDGKKFLDGTGS